MKRERRGPDPVWLVFVPPGLARGWLLFHTASADGTLFWLALAVNASLLLALLVLTWLFATDLANAAGLGERAKERFLVMATLSALAPPLGIAVAQTAHWGSFTAVELILLWGLRAAFRLLSRKSDHIVSREKRSAWVLHCLPSVPGLWLIGSAFAAFWPRDSRSWLALNIPGWQASALLPVTQLWIVAVCACGLLLAIGSTCLSFWWQHALLLQMRKLVGMSLLLCAALVGVEALTWIMGVALDGYIYTLQALALTIPVCNAALFALPYMMTEHLALQSRAEYKIILHVTFLAILSLYFCSQLFTYMVTGPGYSYHAF